MNLSLRPGVKTPAVGYLLPCLSAGSSFISSTSKCDSSLDYQSLLESAVSGSCGPST